MPNKPTCYFCNANVEGKKSTDFSKKDGDFSACEKCYNEKIEPYLDGFSFAPW